MGYYINPENETKEQFLSREAERISVPFYPTNPQKTLICLVNNGVFTSAGICYSKEKFEEFTYPKDNRPKIFYVINKQKLYAVSNITEKDFR